MQIGIPDGYVRDLHYLARSPVPVWFRRVSPVTARRSTALGVDVSLRVSGVEISPGDWVVADADGVVVVPRAATDQVLDSARARAEMEQEIRTRVLAGSTPIEALGEATKP